jgi:hypothetical protein
MYCGLHIFNAITLIISRKLPVYFIIIIIIHLCSLYLVLICSLTKRINLDRCNLLSNLLIGDS